jgi:hypothetical protein
LLDAEIEFFFGDRRWSKKRLRQVRRGVRKTDALFGFFIRIFSRKNDKLVKICAILDRKIERL